MQASPRPGPSDSASEARGRTARTAFILVTVLLDTLGLGLIIPVGPRLVGSFLDNDLAASSYWFGIIVSVYSVMQFLFAPVVGGLSDHFGRRPVILVSLCGAAFSYLVSGFAPALAWLFVGRVIAGITGASFTAAGAYIADVTPPEKRAQAFGLVGAAFGLGFILGPALGGALGDVGLRVPYFVAAGLNGANLLYGIFVLPESLTPPNRRRFSLARANPLGALRALKRHKMVFGLTGTVLCAYFAQWIMQSTWTLHNQSRFGWSLRDVGLSLMAVGVGTAIVQGALVKPVRARIGERRMLVIGIGIAILGHIAFALANQGWMMYAILGPLAFAGLSGPAAQAIISREVGPSEQGEMQGALNGLNGIAAIIAPLIGTALLAQFATHDADPYIPGAAFFASAAFNVVGLVLALRLFARHAAKETETSKATDAADAERTRTS